MKINRLVSAPAVLAAFLGVACPLLAQQLTFNSANITTGSGPVGMVPVDVNRDGYMDLVCANYGFQYDITFGVGGASGRTLSVFTNNGGGVLSLSATLTVGLEPLSVAAADVNGDAWPDLISANVGSNSLSVLTNDGKGGFAVSGTYGVGAAPVFVTTADVNGDGAMDLISVNWGENSMSVLTNNGHGGFKLSALLLTGSNPNCVAAADINGDGSVDLICANSGNSTLQTFTNNGRGVFKLSAMIHVVGGGPAYVVATDVDHDGTIDLVVGSGSSAVTVLTNNGHGTFGLHSTASISSLGSSGTIMAADMNGDGNVDLVCPVNNNNIPGYGAVLTNDGHGNFTANTTVPIGIADWLSVGGNYPNFAAAADFLGDGNNDMVVSCYGTATITELTQINVAPLPTVTISSPLNDSLIPTTESFAINATVLSPTKVEDVLFYIDGKIVEATTNAPYLVNIAAISLSPGSHALQAVAIDSDNHNGWSAEVQINITSSKVLPAPVVNITSPANGASFSTTGSIKVTTSDNSSVNLVQLYIDGVVFAATSIAPYSFQIPAGALVPGDHSLQAVAFNSQSARASSSPVNIVVNQPGTLLTFKKVTLAAGNGPSFVLPVDLNGDGHVDLVAPDYGYAPNGCIGSYNGADGSNVSFWINNGQGAFPSRSTIEIGDPALEALLQPEPECVAAADLNGDGKLELLVANFYYNTIEVFTNNGQGSFAGVPARLPPGGRGPVYITTADVNGDGKPDVISVNNYDSNVSVLTNGGNFNFTNAATLSNGYGQVWVAVADFNGDGFPDLVSANYGNCGDGNTLTVYTGDGHGGFTATATNTVGDGPACVVAADVNGDGFVDLISANQSGNSLTVLTNDGHGKFTLKSTILLANPACVVATNITGNGRMDLAVVSSGTGTAASVTVLANDGLGNFSVNAVIPVGAVNNTYYPDRIAAADFNGDGEMDLVVANYSANSLTVLTQTTPQPPPPVVNITAPANGASFFTDQAFAVAATTTSAVSKVELYVDGALLEQTTTAPYSFQFAAGSLPTGGHTLQAVAINSRNISGVSPAIYITVNTPGTALIDFDPLSTAAGAVGGTLLANYLAGFGVTLADTTAGTTLEAVNTNSLTGSIQVGVPSSPNFFTQAGLNQPVSFTLRFATNLQSFEFTRAGLTSQSGFVSHPQWTATAFDFNGTELSSVSEGLILSSSPVASRSFALTGEGIASVRFDSDSQQAAAFSAVLLDNLVLSYNPAAPPLSVALLVLNPPTNDIVAPATITLRASVTDLLSSSYSVSFFAGPSLLGTVTAPPYRLILTGVLPGNYAFQARAVDTSGLTAQSPVVPITVHPEPNSTVVNFDALNASRGPVEGTALSGYLAGVGISIANFSPGTALAVESQQNIAGGLAALASSQPNVLTQIGSNGPVQFTLSFSRLLSQFGFTRPELLANPFVSHPAWQVTALNGAGVVVGQVAEGEIDSTTNVGAREFTLSSGAGPGIAQVVFSSEGSGLTTFNAMLVDDLVLTTNTTSFPPAVAITQPVSGSALAAPPALTITAAASDAAGITGVSFYASGVLIGTATTKPYAVTWTNITVGTHPLKAVATNTLGLTSTSEIVRVIIQPSAYLFGVASQPASQTIAAGGSVTFNAVPTGTNNVACQWSFNGAPIPGATSQTLILPPPLQDANAGTYTLALTAGGTTIFTTPAVLTIVDPPTFTVQPRARTVPSGSVVNLIAAAQGGGLLTWRWLLNGTAIPGATNSTYSIAAAQPLQSGNYQVVVANMAASAVSAAAPVIVQTPVIIPENNDNFANRTSINPLLGPVSDSNQLATLEPGEPLPDGLKGGKSIWFTWHASFTGTVSLTTAGSDFETLLAVYTGTKLTALKAVAADKDSGGYLTSLVTFNVTEGTDYQIDVDGYQGVSGRVVLGLPAGTGYRVLNPSSGDSVPVIVHGPASKVVAPNASATFNVQATSPTKVTYQWYFQGAPIAGATASALTISHVQTGSVGLYDVLVANPAGSAQSEPANLQIGVNQGGTVTSTESEFVNTPGSASPKQLAQILRSVASGGDTRGFSVAQTFSTVGATREPGEPDPCGQVGGASQWFVYTAPGAGMMQINTDGSSFNTLLGIYTGSGTSFDSLTEVGCGYTTNFAADGQPSVILPGVTAGTTVYIQVDGYQGASGVVQLQIGLGQPLTFHTLPPSQLVTAGSNATFNVTAIGSTPMFYQWQLNGANVAGATAATLKIANAQQSAVGNYAVIVSNVLGVVTSSPPAALTLQFAPRIVSGPSNQTVTLGQAAKFAVTAVGVNMKTNPFVFQWYFNGAPLKSATSQILSFPATHWTNNGSYELVISNTFGAVTSTPAILTLLDKIPPTVTIMTPPNNIVTNSMIVKVTGTAADSVGVSNVQVEVNTEGFRLANGSNNWTIAVMLLPGNNVISARSEDLAGNFSTVATHEITYTPAAVPMGRKKPAAESAANTLPAAAGTYSGLFYPASGATKASSGFFTATLASGGDGAFSANILLDEGSYPFTGRFDTSGDAQSIVPRAGKPSVTASLHLDLDPPDGQMTGVISNADWRSILQAGRAALDAATNPAPASAGQFALVVPSGASSPVGFLDFTNTPRGTALVTGTLADGANIVRAAPMVKGAAIPLYAPLYSGKGLFLGWITFTNWPAQANSDGGFWIKPGSTNVTGVIIVK